MKIAKPQGIMRIERFGLKDITGLNEKSQTELLSHFQGGVQTPPFNIEPLNLPCPSKIRHRFFFPIPTMKCDIFYPELAKIVYDK
jgi:hypothetical protein